LLVTLVDVEVLVVVVARVVAWGTSITATVSLCIRCGCESSIRNVKVKSRNELDLGRATPPDIEEEAFLVQIRHGSGG
jgi:hypothetical protein